MVYIYLGTLLLLLGIFSYKGYRNTQHVVVNKVRVELNNRPSERLLNVLHISDMHMEHISISPEQLYEKLKKENIDLIALTGDFLDRKRSIPKLVPYLQMFKKLNSKYGIYAIFGNHDYVLNDRNFAMLKKTLEKHGCKTLQNEHDTFMIDGLRINIIGIDDFSTHRSDLSASYNGLTQGYNLVLTHDPNIVLEMKPFKFDYLLAGHFHGGQIHWPKPYHLAAMGKLVKMDMLKGLHVYHGKPFYISEGLGQTGINIRMGSRPEITLHQLQLSSAQPVMNKTLTAV
ncbi:metallophosphoesterase [Paenibacillus apiarius]|uniref:Metallophosphoesterase n=1 Tax=Paenibacillus apiarius TaxID=46240 RepID=A0ABT4E4X4_9BACL|nr:metallophosphoesterase [Paenibacillus apiarius]MCY9517908.1 metallophosphoesterase [Paenibacillus apiarius]MCY9523578.1 metallophosphoesterase [Paenibacillus apiarius]MCY9555293.1 metallophosphoesterase [Paenibacillus apiarius]MCY9557609.1 metallophosphoesterase [Paenibacillus apiarius]MCY9686429.1 metallophosphoesterase [Paenibacillus apiarius]